MIVVLAKLFLFVPVSAGQHGTRSRRTFAWSLLWVLVVLFRLYVIELWLQSFDKFPPFCCQVGSFHFRRVCCYNGGHTGRFSGPLDARRFRRSRSSRLFYFRLHWLLYGDGMVRSNIWLQIRLWQRSRSGSVEKFGFVYVDASCYASAEDEETNKPKQQDSWFIGHR